MKKKIIFFLFSFFSILIKKAWSDDIYQSIQPEKSSEVKIEKSLKSGTFKHFVVVTANDYATKIGYDILEKGGTVADAASLKLPKRIPYHIAMEMLFTGRWLDSEEAARWGLINQVHKSNDLLSKARELAELLASGPPLVYAAIKEVVREAEDMKFNDALNMITKSQFRTVETLYRSEDQLEGARAFSEKRDPIWRGK